MGNAQGLAHCCHHDKHWEYCFDFEGRVDYIKTQKPEDEQELRLRLFQLIPDDQLPGREPPEWAACQKAWDACQKAEAAYQKAEAAWQKAGAAWQKAEAACQKEWDACQKAEDAYQKAEAACRKAGAACQKVWAAYQKAWDACQKAEDAYIAKYQPELDALHYQLFPDCPFDGETIFGGKGGRQWQNNTGPRRGQNGEARI